MKRFSTPVARNALSATASSQRVVRTLRAFAPVRGGASGLGRATRLADGK